MMKLQYASDLHLEFKENSELLATTPLDVEADILILAGDITLLGKNKYYRNPFFDWCSEHFEETYIVPGNHEYYNGFELADTMIDFQMSIRPNVHYINNKSVVINDAEIFFSTLWCKIDPLEIVPVQMGMTDCYRIRYKGRDFNANDYDELHTQSMNWLTDAIAKSEAKHKIVVTHHCPTKRFVDPRFPGSTINSAFCVDLDRYIEQSGIETWIYGHTHYNGGNDNIVGNTRLHCNQLGYVRHGENKAFNPKAVIEVC